MRNLVLALLFATLPPTTAKWGKKSTNAVGVQGDPTMVPLKVDATFGGSVTTSCKATASPPTYVEATDDPLSCDLSGQLRTGFPSSLAVTGPLTDAQLRATPVPVSGTFWQATQPVSGTFWQATQPISSTQLPAALDGLNFKVHEQGTVPVTGTFWQATQPVSGTFWQATQPVSAASLPLPTGAATEATLGTLATSANQTNGTQKAIPRGAAKGANTAADITSSSEGADHQAIDVQIYHGGFSKDPTAIRALTAADVVTANQGGTWTVQPGNTANTTPWLIDLNKVAGTATVTGGVAGAVGVGGLAAAGGAASGNPVYSAYRDTAGVAVPVICDKSAFVNPTTATTTQIIALSGTTVIYVCAYQVNFVGSATANTAIFKYGTGASCATGVTSISNTMFGPTATGSGSQFSMGSGIGYLFKTIAGQALCITTSAATTVGAMVSYAQF